MSFQSKFKEFIKKDYTMASVDGEEQQMEYKNEDIDYFDRYSKLLKKCESIKVENERLINNIYNTKKLSKKIEKHKKYLYIIDICFVNHFVFK